MELVAGTLVAGRFVLERQLGEGGMGVVWAATHAVTRKVVALKMLKPEKARDPVVRLRFAREARAASAVQHPNIIEIRDVLELEDGTPAMVMDLLEGESLGARLERDGAMTLEALAPVMLQVLSAVGTAHAAGVVHRDLKPDNIFLVPDGAGLSVRVLDFGIAKVLPLDGDAAISRGLTNTGVILGTPYYMAPEQIFGERDVDASADVWALGVILYECLSGRRPTEAENVGQILRILTEGSIPPLHSVAPGVPGDVASLVDGMLQRDRKARPASLVEAHATLARHVPGAGTRPFAEPGAGVRPPGEELARASLPVRAVVHGDASPGAATLASTTASTTADRVAGPPPRRRAGLAVAGAIAVLVVGGAVVLLSTGTRSAPASAGPATVIVAPAASQSSLLAPSGAPLPPPVLSATAAAPVSARVPVTAAAPPTRARAAGAAAQPAASPGATPPPAASTTPRFNPYEHM